MSDERLPKKVLYGELASGTRNRGRPKLRFKDVCKRDLTAFGIPHDRWEQQAPNRGAWRAAVYKGAADFDDSVAKARDARKAAQHHSDVGIQVHLCRYCQRECKSRIGLWSHEKHCRMKPDT